MPDSRREFLKKAAVLTMGAGLLGAIPASIQKALAINASPGSTYLDAEHVVFLMQENRSFDHAYGTLQGVRGFNDPRAMDLPNKNKVWLQSNAAGQTFAPFRLNLKDTKSTWMSALPHSWADQVDARNNGKYDKWLDFKNSGNKDYAHLPLTLGYFNRADIPFYYSLADAFTVCDQYFCSALTGTSPNRCFFWTGTIREEQHEKSKAHVWNGEIDHKDLRWTTFPERLEDAGVSWKVYQNELSIDTGLEGEKDDWLANFTDNDLEFFAQYNVRLHAKHLEYLQKRPVSLKQEIEALEKENQQNKLSEEQKKQLDKKRKDLVAILQEQKEWTPERYNKLSDREKSIHAKAFVTNLHDPDYHELTRLTYNDNGTEREVNVPKGDVLHQFRKDVQTGNLPTVSWLVASSNFSDHPGSPWYGAWYVSEVLDILTQNPEVWKKTIFVLNYDENDGYFDHVPPFVPPHPDRPETGLASKNLDTRVEHVTMAQEKERGYSADRLRESPIGLGYRVPMVIASPWSRGGWVNSQVFDHTSCLQFLETFLNKKTSQKIEETNISSWRRSICGDLTSVFRPYNNEKFTLPTSVNKNAFIQSIHQAKFKDLPAGFKLLTPQEVESINKNTSELLPQQEQGTRNSCALPYQIYANGQLSADKRAFKVSFASNSDIFGDKTAGVPFQVYAPGTFRQTNAQQQLITDTLANWAFAVSAGDKLAQTWPLAAFENNAYHLRTYGPNGFFREFMGNAQDPALEIQLEYERHPKNKKQLTGNAQLKIKNTSKNQAYTVEIIDLAYKANNIKKQVKPTASGQAEVTINLDLKRSSNWYDFSVKVTGHTSFEQRFAGRVETGKHGSTDPFMGRAVV
ncbi:phosphocholine-specific phospholipase C [Adhaeribacter radiodurans]|uniref:phospholipase C n=1 Tax=Adhaeribacter radiodurans TaxID=2745197 RepID=A0A7L7L8K2_9BACT|nr:phospholipase C, phosphocholine-specific [Adhaeribacter radiodurans]QMU29156.1 phospholipase C, phosphocholine-specific [Adhaeribacter radiodurans]